MSEGQVKILDGNTFVVSDERGDIDASHTYPTGLFSMPASVIVRRWHRPSVWLTTRVGSFIEAENRAAARSTRGSTRAP